MVFKDLQVSSNFSVSSPSDHVLLVELNRKPVNAFNTAFWTELGQLFDSINTNGEIRVVVLASAMPKLFTAGLDLNDTSALTNKESDPAHKALVIQHGLGKFQNAISSIERCRQPVILAAHGVVLGLGVDIATACDVRYAAADVNFSIKEVDIGLAADIGTLARLGKVTGNESFARELAFTGRYFSATEALSLGLVSRVVPGSRNEVIQAALETAKLIAKKSPIPVIGIKKVMIHAKDHSVQENLEYVSMWNSAALQASDLETAVKSALTKTVPKYPNLPKL
ncbi:enoyl- hydratase isomerase family [Pyrrhoderma noxium]|uniref:Enoyl-hydratase isomerase family n=1 Tax=Pyrrhoderma noxium TaxID=2282107 RepID=A0A286UDV8_9AGAM|nr:enoyl- hydratase isomerase family [Pyrrhoderma noxium]